MPGAIAAQGWASQGGARVALHAGLSALPAIFDETGLPVGLLDGVADDASTYFVHGYAAPVTADCIAACTHGERFAAMVQRGVVAGAQFHPERSATVGARLLSNFLRWNGA